MVLSQWAHVLPATYQAALIAAAMLGTPVPELNARCASKGRTLLLVIRSYVIVNIDNHGIAV